MRAASRGALRHKVIIQVDTETIAADRSLTHSWGTFATVYAEIVPISANESYVAQGVTGSVAYRITCRYVASVVPKMRILWGTRVFEIYGVRNLDERNRYLVMTCEELDV
jgi:SPP1 family predicted phage head-tail adaptor